MAGWVCGVALAGLAMGFASVATAHDAWYVQGDFAPVERVAVVIANDLDEDRPDAPVVIRRDQLPMLADIQELTVTLVDPSGAPRPEPSPELLARQGPHERRGEANGRALDYQFDDLDRDGIWDELFFVVDLKAGERKTLHLYRGFQQRGWNPHRTHAAIGSYMRHTVPFWESETVGWKLWFPTDIDLYAKRKPVLMSNRLYMGNLDGYGVGAENPDYGADIMSVDDSFGGGGIGVYEGETLARPRFTPTADLEHRFNAGQQSDTRYSFDVLVNGPLRSMVRVRTMNWNTGRGVTRSSRSTPPMRARTIRRPRCASRYGSRGRRARTSPWGCASGRGRTSNGARPTGSSPRRPRPCAIPTMSKVCNSRRRSFMRARR